MFENNDFAPNDPQLGWRGTHRGKKVTPGVYIYVVEVTYVDGETEIFSGDITVIK